MPDTSDADGLTVGQLSTRLGVTVRALHHWDEVGLAYVSVALTGLGGQVWTGPAIPVVAAPNQPT